jgi:hypothetical protein
MRSDYHYAYNEAFQLVLRVDSITGYKWTAEFDSLGRPIAEWEHLPGMRAGVRMFYSADGSVRIDSTHKLTEATFNHLDDRGNITAYFLVTGDLDTLVRGSFSYDVANRVLEELRYEGDQLVKRNQNTYNDQGQLLEAITYVAAERKEHKLTNTYDSEGRLSASVLRYGGGKPDLVRQYEYKRNDRWEHEMKDGNIVSSVKKSYVYYSAEKE